jgi:hypothetical protein
MLARVRRGFTFANVCSFLALTIALGTGTAYAANTVFSEDIVNGEVKNVDIHSQAVGTGKLADGAVTSVKVEDEALTALDLGANAVASSEVLNNSLTTADIAGADVSGHVSLSGVANGRCSNVTLGVSGAQVGQVAIIATNTAMQNGIIFYALRVSSANHVEAAICNLSGTTMTAIVDMPVRVITFG